jgi:hypothetical protein
MRLAAGGLPFAVKRRAMNRSTKLKISPYKLTIYLRLLRKTFHHNRMNFWLEKILYISNFIAFSTYTNNAFSMTMYLRA